MYWNVKRNAKSLTRELYPKYRRWLFWKKVRMLLGIDEAYKIWRECDKYFKARKSTDTALEKFNNRIKDAA